MRRKGLRKYSGFKSPVAQHQPTTFHEGPQILTVWTPACALKQYSSYPLLTRLENGTWRTVLSSFRKVVKLEVGYRTKQRKGPIHQPQQPTLSRSSSTASTNVPLSYQQPQQPEATAREYIYIYSRNSDSCRRGHPASLAEPNGAQGTATAQRTPDFIPSC